MIQILEEITQKEYNFSNGCDNCGSRDLSDDIKNIGISPKYKGRGIMLTLCARCREEMAMLIFAEKARKEGF